MAYIQKLVCSNDQYSWNEYTLPVEANGYFIADIEQVTTDDELMIFQEAFAAVHGKYFDESLELIDNKLVVSRTWSTLDSYNNYKSKISNIENDVNLKMEQKGWVIEESITSN